MTKSKDGGGILDDIRDAALDIPIGGKCTFGTALLQLSEEDRETVITALWNYPGTAIAAALKKRGVQVNSQFVRAATIQRHRRGVCSCPDELRGIDGNQ